MQYNYVAYNLDEGLVKGRIEAKDDDIAWSEVEKLGHKPLRIGPVWQPLWPGAAVSVTVEGQVGTPHRIHTAAGHHDQQRG